MLPVVKREAARHLLMDAQGLLADPRRRLSRGALLRLVEQMGFVQLDSINVVERAHHLTLSSRADDYRHADFQRLLERDRTLFEHWTHDASAIPTKWFAHWKPRFARERERLRAHRWWAERMGGEPEKTIAYVRERIAREGPLRSQDFEHETRDAKASAWWSWKPQKAALEFLWTTGELSVARRAAFQKVYDLTERVFPDEHRAPAPSLAEQVEWACSTALERLVVATPKEIADFWKAIEASQAREWCAEAASDGRISMVLSESPDGAPPRPAYALNDWEQRLRKLPEPPARMRLLCPFDPVLRDRARALRLFDFDYRFEAFVPEPQRQYGYYVLPVLEGDRLVGRLDPKFHRAESLLEIRRLFWERGIRVTRARRRLLEEATARLAQLVGATRISWPE